MSMCYGESFHSSLLAFLFVWWTKRWEIAEEMLIECTAFTYYVTLMAKCMCTWLHHPLKLLPSTFLPCTDSIQPGWFNVETYMRVLELWFANTAAAEIVIKYIGWYIGRSLSSCADLHHKLQHFMLEQIELHFSPCNLPMQLLLCVNKLLLTSAWQQA